MSTVRKSVVIRGYLVEKLPEDLRRGFPDKQSVTVRLEEEEEAPVRAPMSLDEILALRRPPFRDPEEILESIRRGREDRDG